MAYHVINLDLFRWAIFDGLASHGMKITVLKTDHLGEYACPFLPKHPTSKSKPQISLCRPFINQMPAGHNSTNTALSFRKPGVFYSWGTGVE